MKKILFTLLGVIAISFLAYRVDAQVLEEKIINNQGMPFIRLHNTLNYAVSCQYRDQANYFTFILYPRSASRWIPIYGYYQWGCD